MKNSLKTASSDYFTSFSLDDDALTAFYETISQPSEKPRRFYLKQVFAGMIAGILIAVLSNLVINRDASDPYMQIASEVAANHLHRDPLEIQSNDYSEVQRYFSELDFVIAASSHFNNADGLIGARYCSLKGLKAAQIRLQTEKQPATLYQVAYDEAVFGHLPDIEKGEQPILRYADGVKVEIWVENGVLMSSAEEIAN